MVDEFGFVSGTHRLFGRRGWFSLDHSNIAGRYVYAAFEELEDQKQDEIVVAMYLCLQAGVMQLCVGETQCSGVQPNLGVESRFGRVFLFGGVESENKHVIEKRQALVDHQRAGRHRVYLRSFPDKRCLYTKHQQVTAMPPS